MIVLVKYTFMVSWPHAPEAAFIQQNMGGCPPIVVNARKANGFSRLEIADDIESQGVQPSEWNS